MRFIDRTDAGQRLAKRLLKYQGQDGIVFALPRGGVPLAAEISRALGMPLDLVSARKIGHPFSPEYAIAAVTDTGELAVNPLEVSRVDRQWFEREVEIERLEAVRRRQRYLKNAPPRSLAGKVAILVDDGIATGLTMEAAIMQARQRKPQKLVLAVPVAPQDTAAKLAKTVDELVALDIPEHYLGAVGAYYDDFRQISDEEVEALLAELADAQRN